MHQHHPIRYALALTLAAPSAAGAQIVQAARGLADAATETGQARLTTKLQCDGKVLASEEKVLAESLALGAAPDTPPVPATRAALARAAIDQERVTTARRLGREALAASGDPAAFFERYRAYEAALEATSVGASDATLNAAYERNGLKSTSDTTCKAVPNPVPAVLVRDVVFTLGFDATVGGGAGSRGVSLGTNLLGAAAGTLFDAIGSTDLQNYLKGNIAVATNVPTGGGSGRLSAQLGLGLGEVTVRGRGAVVALWPVLTLDQSDTADRRTPAELRTLQPAERSWSSPGFSIGVALAPRHQVEERLKAGKLVPVVSVGVGLPYYYAGDPLNALAAFFTNKRGDYERAGRARLTLGVGIPLLRVKPATDPGSTSNPS